MSELPSVVTFSEDVAKAEQPDPLPAGQYRGEIRKVEPKMSGAGNKYAAVHFFITPDQYPADYPPENNPDGMTMVYNRVMLEDTGRNRWRMRQFIEAIGAKGGKELDLNSWIGLAALVDIDHEDYEGETRERVTAVHPEM